MPIGYEASRLAWLSATLVGQRNKIVCLYRRLAGFGTLGNMKPSLFRKFLRMLEQVAADKDKEARILSQIEAIEQKHRFLRKNGTLKKQDDKPLNDNDVLEEDYESKHPGRGWLWFLGLWYLLSKHGINQKKQDLTAN